MGKYESGFLCWVETSMASYFVTVHKALVELRADRAVPIANGIRAIQLVSKFFTVSACPLHFMQELPGLRRQ